MKTNFKWVYVFFLLLVSLFSLKGQVLSDTTQLWQIITTDDNEYVGYILDRTAETIRFKTNAIGNISISTRLIKSIVKVEDSKLVKGELWADNPQASRYFWGPNAHSLKKGEGYYQNVWVLFNQVSYGFSDQFTLGLGTVPLFLFGGGEIAPVWVTPKISFPVKKNQVNFGVGALAGTVLGEESASFGIVYGATTFGDRDKNFNIGLGYGYAGDSWADSPTISLSGMIRTGKKGYFITENYYLSAGDESFLLLSVGGRVVWKNLSLDYGGVIPAGSEVDTLVVVPWLGIVIPFGGKR